MRLFHVYQRFLLKRRRLIDCWLSLSWRKNLFLSVIFCFFIIAYCTFMVYYIAILQCFWPKVLCDEEAGYGEGFPGSEGVLKAMILSDTHLLGRSAVWIDRIWREWQMKRSFQTAISILQPNVVFILGDVFDEGYFSPDRYFLDDLQRFNDMFHTTIPMIVVAGNHDVGFHYRVIPYVLKRFESTFLSQSVQLHTIKGLNFVTINSMAFEGDECDFCQEASRTFSNISSSLKEKYSDSPPVILLHFPLYRSSDEACQEPDAAPLSIKSTAFRQKWDCLSQSATAEILKRLRPRAVFSGHTHHGCYREHSRKVPEWTVSSFNWRHKINPSFLMVSMCSRDLKVHRCLLPNERTVFAIFAVSASALAVSILGRLLFFYRTHKNRLD